MRAISQTTSDHPALADVAIVGAGPIGLELAAALKQAGLDYIFAPETMETNVPGLYVAGTAAAGTQQRYRLFIENCHQHVAKIVAALTGQPYQPATVVKDRPYEV